MRTFALAQLVHSPLNARRRKRSTKSLEELAALILSQGVLQNLVGYLEKLGGRETGKVAIAAGGGRLDVCLLLQARGELDAGYPVPVKLVGEEEAMAASLAENAGREPMHLADQVEAMRAMVEGQGRHVEEVAAAFGISAVRVRRRMALANVSPRLLALFREDEMEYEQLVQFTLTNDHQLQEQVWEGTPEYQRRPQYLRQLLTQQEVPIRTDRLARFVGIKAYEKAGGEVRRDLFSDSDDGYMKNVALLEMLARRKLDRVAGRLKAEGASWVDVLPRASFIDLRAYEAADVRRRTASPEEQAELDSVEVELRELDEAMSAAAEDGSELDALAGRRDQAAQKLDLLEQSLEEIVPEQQALVGAVVRVDEAGKVAVHRDLIRPDDMKALRKAAKAAASGEEGGKACTDGNAERAAEHSERLVRRLTAHRTLALQAGVAANPHVALTMLLHRLVKNQFIEAFHGGHPACQIASTQPALSKDAPDLEESSAWQQLQAARETWRDQLPDDPATLFPWLLSQSQDTLLSLLSFCAGCCVNGVSGSESRNEAADQLASALELDMADWWAPTAEGYFLHVPKHRIEDVVTEAVSAEAGRAIGAMKKKEAAAAAEKALEGGRWLPALLRLPS